MADRFARNARQSGDMASRVADPGLAALAGLNAFAEGRYGDAFAQLVNARPKMQTIGGWIHKIFSNDKSIKLIK